MGDEESEVRRAQDRALMVATMSQWGMVVLVMVCLGGVADWVGQLAPGIFLPDLPPMAMAVGAYVSYWSHEPNQMMLGELADLAAVKLRSESYPFSRARHRAHRRAFRKRVAMAALCWVVVFCMARMGLRAGGSADLAPQVPFVLATVIGLLVYVVSAACVSQEIPMEELELLAGEPHGQ